MHFYRKKNRQQADPNLTNRNGQTPLHTAAAVGYTDIIRVLLQANLDEPCDPTIVDSQQLTAYQLAKANHHETCAKLIDEYQQGWTRLSPRREGTGSINEQEINPVLTNNPLQRFQDTQDDSSDETSSRSSSRSSRSSSRQIQQPPKQETRTLADMIKNNPVQPEMPKTNVAKPNNQTLSSMINNNPVQPEMPKTNVAKPNNQTLSSMINNIPLQPSEIPATKPVIRKFLRHSLVLILFLLN